MSLLYTSLLMNPIVSPLLYTPNEPYCRNTLFRGRIYYGTSLHVEPDTGRKNIFVLIVFKILILMFLSEYRYP